MTHRHLILVAATATFAITLTMVPMSASAQDVGACFRGCSALFNSIPEGEDVPTDAVMYQRCIDEVPACSALTTSASDLSSVELLCDRLAAAERSRRATPPGFCILPDGTGVADEGARNCGCPAGTVPFTAAPWRSDDRMRSFSVPRGHNVFVCANPLALRGAPGSVDERVEALLATVATHDAALRALCGGPEAAPDADLVALCSAARAEFLAAGSETGPVDLGPLITQIENLESALEDEHAVVDHLVDESRIAHGRLDGHDDMIGTLSRRVDALTECIMHGEGHQVSYTEGSTGETHSYPCPDILRHASEAIVAQARREVARAVSEANLHNNGGQAFVLVQGFGLLAFTQLRYGNTDYGLPWAVGGELTLGIGLGGAWNIQVGGALGATFPDVRDVTNVFAMPHIGFGVTAPISNDVHFMFSFGGLAALRFLPDGRLAHNIYGGYLEGLLRIGARSEWSFVLGLRVFAGASPREVSPGNFDVSASGGGILTVGVGHFGGSSPPATPPDPPRSRRVILDEDE